MDTQNGTVGGGEALQYWGNSKQKGPQYLDENLIKQFLMLPYVKAIIIILLMLVAILVILKILEVRNPFRGKAITHELDHLDRVKKRDESIVRANRYIRVVTKLIESSPFACNKTDREYWEYNLKRANVRIPGGSRVMKYDEFNAIIKSIEIGILCIALFIMIFLSTPLGAIIAMMDIVFTSTLPTIYLRTVVKQKDMEIVENFADFYLMIHYVLLASAGTPISGIMKSFDKTTDSEEMHRFIDVCIHYIDTYGEYEATRYISKEYREVSEVGKLMRLIRQANEGGDIRAELIGFRNELLAAKRYAIEKRMEKMILKANASFNILVPVLIQAVVSAMAIYLDDLGMATTLF